MSGGGLTIDQTRFRSRRAPRTLFLPLAVTLGVVVVGGSVWTLAREKAGAAPTRVTVGSLVLEAVPTVDLAPEGVEVLVAGRGFDERKGIYVAFCVVPAPGTAPGPCGGGIDTAGSTGASAWISSNPPPYGRDLAIPYGPGGSFEQRITVAANFGTTDCTVVACAVVTRNDHTRSEDRSQDVVLPVSFSPVAGAPTPSARVVHASGAASAGSCGPATAVVPTDVEPLDGITTPVLPVTVDSADGGRVTIDSVERILAVNLYGSIAEIVFSLGLGDRVVGRDSSTTFPAAAHLPLVTAGGHDLSTESVLRLDPTVILADASIGPPEVLAQLRASGIPVVLLDDDQTLERVPRHIRAIAAALGLASAGERLVARVEAEIAEAGRAAETARAPGAEPPIVAFLYIRGTAGVYLMAGDGAGPDAMIEGIGAIDAGSSIGLEGFRPITSEALIAAAPDVILTMTDGLASVGGVDGLLAQPGIAQTPAGARRRIVDMDDGLLLNFGARTGRAMTALAQAIYGTCPTG
jgi:iron complex transport system substrate-binding protein